MLVTASDSAGAVSIRLDPPGAPISIRTSRITVGEGGTGGRLVPRWIFGTRELEITGMVPRGGSVRRGVAMADPDSAAGVLFLGALARAGVRLGKVAIAFLPPRGGRTPAWAHGSSATVHAAPQGVPADDWRSVDRRGLSVVASLESPTAAEVVGAIAAHSLNVEAEAVLRLLSVSDREKTRDEGLAALGHILAGAGVDTLDVSLVDGSGLSPLDLVTPRAVVRWLESMERSDSTRGVFRGALAAPSRPGTLEARLDSLPPGVEVRAKTGSLTNVSSLSGYVTTAEGETLAFCMLVNGARRSVAPARAAQDRLVRLLARVPRRRETRWFLPPVGAPR